MNSTARRNNHRRSSWHIGSQRRWLALLSLLVSVYMLTCAAVNVGDDEHSIRLLGEDDDSNGSSDEDVGCPDVTTLAVYSGTSSSAKASNTSAQIVDADSCRSVVVSGKQVQDKDTGESVYELDVRKRDIRRIVGIPSAVRILRLDNNTVESFRPGQSSQNRTTHIYLSNNSIDSLDDFVFPSSLLTLDLTKNDIVSIDNVSFPEKLTMLNLTLNPIESLQFATLPPKLQHLNVAGGSLDRLENFSFPNSLLSLNFSTNPITRIAGVIFPSALNRLVINAGYAASATGAQAARRLATTTTTTEIEATALSTPLLFAKPVVSLEEFEVRRTDAERFQKMALFDVSATSSVKCSDPLAKHFFVNDTMLCVLSDDDFVAKYASVAQAASITDGSILERKNSTQKAKELPLLHETWHQSRSWFLLVSALLLLGLVVAMGVCSCCHASVRRANGAYTNRKSELTKSRSVVNSRPTDMDALERGEKETESLLSNLQEDTVDDEANDANSTDDFVSDVLTHSMSQKLEAFLIAPSRLEFPSSLPQVSLMEPEHRGKKSSQQPSQFIYALASLRNQVVVLKTLQLRDSGKPKKVEFESNRGGISRGCTLKSFSREIQLHSMVSHANIVGFIGYLRGGPFSRDTGVDHDRAETLTLVTEFMNMGTLDNFIEKQKVQLQDALILQRTGVEHVTKEDEEEDRVGDSIDIPGSIRGLHVWSWDRDSPSCKSKLSVAIDIACALVYLHSFSPSLFHGNFSSRKVLLDDSWHVKINDLSCSSALLRWSERQLSVQASESGSSSSSQVDPQEEVQMDMTVWTAPEVIDGQQYTTKADMYSFGILLSYLDTYEFPVDALHRVDSEVAILSSSSYNVIPMIGARSPISIRMLTMQCISFQPEDRPSAEEVLNELLTIQMDLKEMSSSSELAD